MQSACFNWQDSSKLEQTEKTFCTKTVHLYFSTILENSG